MIHRLAVGIWRPVKVDQRNVVGRYMPLQFAIVPHPKLQWGDGRLKVGPTPLQ